MVSAIIVDLDDCLFDSRHLGKYLPEKQDDREGWDLFQEKMSECSVNTYILSIIDSLWLMENIELIFVTGREGNQKLKDLTIEQLDKYFPYYQVFFRPELDYRRAAVVKKEIYEKEIKGKYNVLFAIDDDIENIKMFYKQGINTLHCRYGRNK